MSEKKEQKKIVGFCLESNLKALIVDGKEIRNPVVKGQLYQKGCSCGCFKTEYDLFSKVQNVPEEVKNSQYVVLVEVACDALVHEKETCFGFKTGSAVVIDVFEFPAFQQKFKMSLMDM